MTTSTESPIHAYKPSNWCAGAARSDGVQLDGARSAMHARCRVATRSTLPVKAAGNNATVGSRPALIICSCTCHVTRPNQVEPDPSCTECGHQGGAEVDQVQWLCHDQAACSARVDKRLADNLTWQMLQEAKADGARVRAEKNQTRRGNMSENAPADKAARPRREPKPKVGTCHHCGDPTKGGQFVAGHDAKLKGQLQRIAIDRNAPTGARVDAVTEQLIRGWHKGSFPDALVRDIKGQGTTPEALAQNQRELREAAIAEYEKVRTTAEAKATDKAALDQLVKARTGK